MSLTSASILGTATLIPGEPPVVCRDTGDARWWARPAARWLARREMRALRALTGEACFPALLGWDGRRLYRSVIPGRTMREAAPRSADYFRRALRLLARMHRHGVAHNDLAREPNWLVTGTGEPALIDFQLAWCDRSRGRLFRIMAREDLRHLLKHKRYYCPERLSARERRLLASPGAASRLWRAGPAPVLRALARALDANR